ncbi:unnamed protein product [Prorocentrum cordatum]|uniref:K Homology domain-containing protein n=1 Tax=Prorocentrum cordatum TaxID=2364126 RepID=A0ABN9WAC6_9DINO|nr:unnamed protein product [Polarella glacialis]
MQKEGGEIQPRFRRAVGHYGAEVLPFRQVVDGHVESALRWVGKDMQLRTEQGVMAIAAAGIAVGWMRPQPVTGGAEVDVDPPVCRGTRGAAVRSASGMPTWAAGNTDGSSDACVAVGAPCGLPRAPRGCECGASREGPAVIGFCAALLRDRPPLVDSLLGAPAFSSIAGAANSASPPTVRRPRAAAAMPARPCCGWQGAPCVDPVQQQRLIGVRMLLQALGVLTSAAFATIALALFGDRSAVLDFWSGCHWLSEGVVCLFVAAVCLVLEAQSFFYAAISHSLLSHASHRLLLASLYLWLGAYSVGGRIQQGSEVWRTFGKVTGVIAWVVAVGDVSISPCYIAKTDPEPEVVTEHVTVPASAVGAVWGPQTSTKHRLERDHGVRLKVTSGSPTSGASSEATVEVSGRRPSACTAAAAEIHQLVQAASDTPDLKSAPPRFGDRGSDLSPTSLRRSETCGARLALGGYLPSLPAAEAGPATTAGAEATRQAAHGGGATGALASAPPPQPSMALARLAWSRRAPLLGRWSRGRRWRRSRRSLATLPAASAERRGPRGAWYLEGVACRWEAGHEGAGRLGAP